MVGTVPALPSATPPPAPPQAPVAMVLGDSFTVGSGPVRAWDAYATLVARELGWQPVIAGAAGTGYLNPGRVGRTFEQSFRQELSWRPEPDLLIISGGHNDRRVGAARVGAAAARLLELARRTWPYTRIVVVGPIWMTRAPRWAYLVRDAVATAADEAAVPFLDPLEPRGGRWGRGTVLPDGVHPTAAGHARLAGWMITTLREYGIEPRR
ncbi:SGNH/GDSL hydrolase family protein [Streptosporangium fragile]|uniref:SGNH/GDSL hydrolase family protein n=1 Tax=Streptosporangium fragile TaxID=46186 RepID=A0ABN3W394_9ACTN